MSSEFDNNLYKLKHIFQQVIQIQTKEDICKSPEIFNRIHENGGEIIEKGVESELSEEELSKLRKAISETQLIQSY